MNRWWGWAKNDSMLCATTGPTSGTAWSCSAEASISGSRAAKWRARSRAVASQMRPALYKATAVDVAVGRLGLKASGSVLVFPGHLRAYGETEEERPAVERGHARSVACRGARGATGSARMRAGCA